MAFEAPLCPRAAGPLLVLAFRPSGALARAMPSPAAAAAAAVAAAAPGVSAAAKKVESGLKRSQIKHTLVYGAPDCIGRSWDSAACLSMA